MKKHGLLILLFFNVCLTQAQDVCMINGEWKVVSIDDGDVYLNTKNDSVALSDMVKRSYVKSAVGFRTA